MRVLHNTQSVLQAYWGGKLSPFQRGAVMMLVASLAFAVMALLIRLASKEIHPLQIAFLRNIFALLFLLPWLVPRGRASLHTGRISLHIGRALSGICAMSLWFSSLTYLPLAEATSLNFTVPLFTTIGAALFLGERVRARRLTAIAIGFIGVLIILRPGFRDLSYLMIMPLAAAFFMAISSLIVKKLSHTESAMTIVMYQNLFLVPISLVPALFFWTSPSLYALFLGASIGGVSVIAHILVARAFKLVEVSAISPFGYLRLPLIAGFGYLFFAEVTDIWTWVGAGVIIASSFYIAYRESRLKLETPEERQAKYTSKAGL